ncbi:MAG: IS1595 family transposase [Proteobacteria bacterium]|nr:IS1595 family transposase [Pseudomonadota bacterium]
MKITEITRRWPDHESAMAHLEKVRWNGHVVCPYCKSEKTCTHASKDHSLPRWQCQDCTRAFSATVGTIFHHTHLPLQTWFLALAIMLNAKKGVSNAQLSRDLGLPYKTAWSLALRIRNAMLTDPAQKRLFQGIVEMDEVYIGGKPRKGGPKGGSGAKKSKRGRGTAKLPVVGVVERHGRVVARAFNNVPLNSDRLNAFFSKHVDGASAIVMTDEFGGYRGLKAITTHYAVDHKVAYVSGETHTNTIEGFWSLVKRSWYGQHHFYSRKWADHYVSETAFKYNNRNNPDVFSDLMRHMAGVAA